MRKAKSMILVLLIVSTVHSSAQVATEIPTGKKFHIQSAMNYGKNNGGYWDIPGHPKTIEKGSNIQVFDLDQGHDRTFSLHTPTPDGYYEIKIGNTINSRIDIQGKGTNNGTSVKTWTRNHNNNQKFLFHHLGNGRFKIYDRNSKKVLCLANRSSSNKSNVHIWSDHNGAWVEWYLIDVKTKKPFIPQNPTKGKTKIEKPVVVVNHITEAEERFNEYKNTDTLTTRRLQFKQGYLDVYSSEPYTFLRIINQKPMLDAETYDASGAILIEETSQWIFWDKQNKQSTGKAAKIMFYISTNRFPEIKHDTNLGEMPINLKNKVGSFLNSSIKSNPVQLNISNISHPQVTYLELNGHHVAYAVSTAKSDVDLIISSYVIFLKNNEVFVFKVTMANDERRMILEDLVDKLLLSLTYY